MGDTMRAALACPIGTYYYTKYPLPLRIAIHYVCALRDVVAKVSTQPKVLLSTWRVAMTYLSRSTDIKGWPESERFGRLATISAFYRSPSMFSHLPITVQNLVSTHCDNDSAH